MLDSKAIGLRPIRESPFAVVDVETTGLVPGADRIVEIAIVRVDAAAPPTLVLETLVNPMRPMAATEIHGLKALPKTSAGARMVSRPRTSDDVPDTRKSLGHYMDELTAIVSDGVVSDDEICGLAALRERFKFRPEEIRSVHARLFGVFLSMYADDQWLAECEAESLRTLRRCLSELGWAPGD